MGRFKALMVKLLLDPIWFATLVLGLFTLILVKLAFMIDEKYCCEWLEGYADRFVQQ